VEFQIISRAMFAARAYAMIAGAPWKVMIAERLSAGFAQMTRNSIANGEIALKCGVTVSTIYLWT
jgi:hypothetical protein